GGFAGGDVGEPCLDVGQGAAGAGGGEDEAGQQVLGGGGPEVFAAAAVLADLGDEVVGQPVCLFPGAGFGERVPPPGSLRVGDGLRVEHPYRSGLLPGGGCGGPHVGLVGGG